MKILIVGSNKPWAIERFYIKYLREFGAEVQLYGAPDIVFDYHSKNIFNKILFKSKIKTGYKKVNAGLLERAASFEPDVIWVFKGMEIYPVTLKRLRERFKLANYNPDHPFIIGSSGGGNNNVKDSVGFYHLHFCYNSTLQKRIEEEYRISTVFLPFGFDLSEQDYQIASAEPEVKRICFLGNPDKEREETLQWIAAKGIPVDVYGHGWNKTSLNGQKNLNVYDAVYGIEFWKKLRSYRVQLNIFRAHNEGSHNMRTFEIPAVGGIELAPGSPEHKFFFHNGREIFLYNNREELFILINDLLARDGSAVLQIREAARFRSLNSAYSYRDRANTVYTAFKDMLGNG